MIAPLLLLLAAAPAQPHARVQAVATATILAAERISFTGTPRILGAGSDRQFQRTRIVGEWRDTGRAELRLVEFQ